MVTELTAHHSWEKREGKGEDTGRRETEGEREKRKEEGGLEVKKGRYYSILSEIAHLTRLTLSPAPPHSPELSSHCQIKSEVSSSNSH